MIILAERANLSRAALWKMQKAQLRAADLSVAQVLRDLKAALNAESRVERLLALSREQRDILSWSWPYAEDTELPLALPAARALGNDIADEIQRRRAPMIREAHAVVGRTFIAIAERAYVAYQWIVDSMDQAMVDALGRVREERAVAATLLAEQEGEALPFPDHARLTGLYVPATNEQTMRWVNARAPWDGKALLNRFEDLEGVDRAMLRRQLVQGLRQGQGMAKVARNVRKGVGMVQHRATTIARTEIMRASHEAKEEAFAIFRKDGTIGGVGILGTLDDRTCEICAFYDRTEYYYNKEPRISEKPMLPIHPRCRCSEYGISGLWDKLGVPKDQRWTGYRAGRGVKVPVDTDFNGWLRRMEKAHPGYGGKLFTSKARYAAWMQGQDVRSVIRSAPGIWKRIEAAPKYGSARTRLSRGRRGQVGGEPPQPAIPEGGPRMGEETAILPDLDTLGRSDYALSANERATGYGGAPYRRVPEGPMKFSEAKDLLRDNFGIGVEGKGEVAGWQPIVSTLARLDARYGKLQPMQGGRIWFGKATGSQAGNVAWGGKYQRTMSFNTRYFGAENAMRAEYVGSTRVSGEGAIRWAVPVRGENAHWVKTIAHEYGHRLHMHASAAGEPWTGLGAKMAKTRARIWDTFERFYDRRGAEWFDQNVSGLAGVDMHEAFAESFVSYVGGTARPEIFRLFRRMGL